MATATLHPRSRASTGRAVKHKADAPKERTLIPHTLAIRHGHPPDFIIRVSEVEREAGEKTCWICYRNFIANKYEAEAVERDRNQNVPMGDVCGGCLFHTKPEACKAFMLRAIEREHSRVIANLPDSIETSDQQFEIDGLGGVVLCAAEYCKVLGGGIAVICDEHYDNWAAIVNAGGMP